MCFSTQISFGAGALLTVTGIATLTQVKEKKQLPFACIPLIFALQQFTEGFVWLSLHYPSSFHYPLVPTYIFLIIAQIIWPVWVPFSIWLMEADKSRKKVLFLFVVVGIIFALYLIYSMINNPMYSEIDHKHIRYIQRVSPTLILTGAIMYFLTTVISPIISKNSNMKVLGFTIFISFSVSKLYFQDYVVSVWCFFAAMLSVLVYFIIKHQGKTEVFFAKA